VRLVGFTIGIYDDARTCDLQIYDDARTYDLQIYDDAQTYDLQIYNVKFIHFHEGRIVFVGSGGTIVLLSVTQTVYSRCYR
jgi:hypothetical protein